MDLRYLAFCRADSPFYESPATLQIPSNDFVRGAARLMDGWERSHNAEWVVMSPPVVNIPAQGWKIHASATPDNAEHVLDVVWDYCVPRGVMFKFIRSAEVLKHRNSKYGDRGSSGKFVTIYPVDEAELGVVLSELGDLLDGTQGPYILSDLRWRAGPLYVRYGGFVDRTIRDDRGRLVHCIEDPDGNLVPDVRGPGFRPPPWATLPQCLHAALAARNSGTLQDFPFRVKRALHFSNGGGVYEATDTRTGSAVLLKEARPLSGLDEDGTDAVARLDREHWALAQLAGLENVPRMVDYRAGHEHMFLIREYVEGRPLGREIVERNPLMKKDAVAQDFADYTAWALTVLVRVDRGVRDMHSRGVVFGDLHPYNIMIRPDSTVSFIDMETSTPLAASAAQAIGAPGFRAPAGYTGADVDLYALACIRIGIFVPLTAVMAWSRSKTEQLLDVIAEHFPVPAGFAEQVRQELGPARPDEAPQTANSACAPLWPTPNRSTWPQLRSRIADHILDTATLDGVERLYPGDIDQFDGQGGGVGFAHGAAGVLWALHAVGTAVPTAHVDWLTDATDQLARPRPGFYDGLSGIAFALDQIGRAEQARQLFERVMAWPLAEVEDASLYGGLAGIGLTVLHFAAADDTLLDRAGEIADRLISQATVRADDSARPGLLHGAAGMALFLLRLYERRADPSYLQHAILAVQRDLEHLRWRADEEPAAAAPINVPFIGVGSAGVGMVLHDLLAHHPDPELTRAHDAIRSAAAMPFVQQSGLLMGRAGVMLALHHLHDGSAATSATVTRHLTALGLHVVPYRDSLAFLGDQTLRLSTDLATGAAGVLLAMDAVLGDRGARLPFFADGRPERSLRWR